LGLQRGMLIANPIPKQYALDASSIEHIIDQASKEADDRGIGGKDLTPFTATGAGVKRWQ
jgi:pseudouridine-5'-phosphate glycosidase